MAVPAVTKERTLRPNRVEGLRPMSHPAAGCAVIILEAEGWPPYAHRCRCGRLWVTGSHSLARPFDQGHTPL